LLIVNSNKLNRKHPKKNKCLLPSPSSHLGHQEEGDDTTVVPFFVAKPTKRHRLPIFCDKAIEEGDE
jgi:hypothetical protein